MFQVTSIVLFLFVSFSEGGNIYRNDQPYAQVYPDHPRYQEPYYPPYSQEHPIPSEPDSRTFGQRIPRVQYRAVEPAQVNPYKPYEQPKPTYRDLKLPSLNPANPIQQNFQNEAGSPHSELFPEIPDLQLGENAVRTQYHGQDVRGNYRFGYNTGDGAFRTEHRSEDGTVQGQYGYMGPEGKFYRFFYIADANGYRVSEDPFELEGAGENLGGENVMNNHQGQPPFERAGGFGGIPPGISTTQSSEVSDKPVSSSLSPVPPADGNKMPENTKFEFTDNRPRGYFSYLFMHPINPGVGPVQSYDVGAESSADEVSIPTEKTTNSPEVTTALSVTSTESTTQPEGSSTKQEMTSAPALDVSVSSSEVTSQTSADVTSEITEDTKVLTTLEENTRIPEISEATTEARKAKAETSKTTAETSEATTEAREAKAETSETTAETSEATTEAREAKAETSETTTEINVATTEDITRENQELNSTENVSPSSSSSGATEESTMTSAQS